MQNKEGKRAHATAVGEDTDGTKYPEGFCEQPILQIRSWNVMQPGERHYLATLIILQSGIDVVCVYDVTIVAIEAL